MVKNKRFLILMTMLLPLSLAAQTVKLAYVNAQEIFSVMPEVPNIESQLSAKQDEINKNYQALEDEFNKKLDEFKANPATSDAGKKDQERQLQQIQERFQLYQQNSQKELNDLQQKLVAPVNKKISDAIKAIGDANNYMFVFDISTFQSPIVYVNPSATDITAQVKTKLGLK